MGDYVGYREPYSANHYVPSINHAAHEELRAGPMAQDVRGLDASKLTRSPYSQRLNDADPAAAAPEVYSDYSTPIAYTQDHEGLQAFQNNPFPVAYSPDAYSQHQTKPVGHEEEPQSNKKRICGLVPVAFWIVVVLIVLIIGAIVGGVAGGVLAGRDQSSSQTSGEEGSSSSTDTAGGNSSSDNATSTSILRPDTRLAAVNWTDSVDTSYHAVFYQDESDALFVSVWNSGSQNWTFANISSNFDSLRAKPGTPLSAVATGDPWSFEMQLFFFTPGNLVTGVKSDDPSGLTWKTHEISNRPRRTADNSQLASTWHRCDEGCSNTVNLIYQDEEQIIQLLNSSDWSATTAVVQDADSGSGLSLIPFNDASGPFEPNPAALRLYCDSSSRYVEQKFEIYREWVPGMALSRLVTLDPPPRFAAAPFDSWRQITIVMVQPGGTLSMQAWDTATWNQYDDVQMEQGPVGLNVTSIALNHDSRLYTFSDERKIEEWTWSSDKPSRLFHLDTIRTPSVIST